MGDIYIMKQDRIQRLSSGINGLDEILFGGLLPQKAYLIRGGPGSGKTTLGAHFLENGVAQSENGLFISLGEREKKLKENALNQNIDLSKVDFLDLGPSDDELGQNKVYDIFSSEEVEKADIIKAIMGQVKNKKPTRIFIDSLTHFRYLITDPYQYRIQMLSLLNFLVNLGATVLFTSEPSSEAPDNDLQFICDGIIDLNHKNGQRTLTVVKLRGSDFCIGNHTCRISDKGMIVFPRLLPEKYRRSFSQELITSGIQGIDEMLHNGIERATTTIITGPSGVGKTSLGFQFLSEAAQKGDKCAACIFEEDENIIFRRSEGMGMPLRKIVETGALSLMKINPLEISPDELALKVREKVENDNVKIIMIDSISGYRLSIQTEDDLISHLHALCKYLSNMGVTTILINETQSVTGDFSATENGISYLGDNILFIRYIELNSRLGKVTGVMKKRLSGFEKTLREFKISKNGISVHDPLTGLQGILSGTPQLIDLDGNWSVEI